LKSLKYLFLIRISGKLNWGLNMNNRLIIKLAGILFIAGGIIHWLIIFDILKEKTPLLITVYFHSLSVLSPAAGAGLLLFKERGRKTALFIAATQIPAHLYMMTIDRFCEWNSGLSYNERIIDIIFACFILFFLTQKKQKQLFS
jgi:hypothetical protein